MDRRRRRRKLVAFKRLHPDIRTVALVADNGKELWVVFGVVEIETHQPFSRLSAACISPWNQLPPQWIRF